MVVTEINTSLLFPVPLFYVNILQYVDNVNNVINSMSESEWKQNTLNTITESKWFLERDDMQPLKNELEVVINTILQNAYDVSPDNNTLSITQSWLNRSTPGQGHHRHEHNNSFLSGVLFLTDNPVATTFHSGMKMMSYYPTKQPFMGNGKLQATGSLSPGSVFKPEVQKGDLILFPSGLEHSVEAQTDQNTRYTLAFNTKVNGEAGNLATITYGGTYQEYLKEMNNESW
jgi:uncharacterized protein (TIGR02466 family)